MNIMHWLVNSIGERKISQKQNEKNIPIQAKNAGIVFDANFGGKKKKESPPWIKLGEEMFSCPCATNTSLEG